MLGSLPNVEAACAFIPGIKHMITIFDSIDLLTLQAESDTSKFLISGR